MDVLLNKGFILNCKIIRAKGRELWGYTMQHKGTKSIETDRLLLRPFVIEDAKAMFENWAADSEVTRYLMWQPHKDILPAEYNQS